MLLLTLASRNASCSSRGHPTGKSRDRDAVEDVISVSSRGCWEFSYFKSSPKWQICCGIAAFQVMVRCYCRHDTVELFQLWNVWWLAEPECVCVGQMVFGPVTHPDGQSCRDGSDSASAQRGGCIIPRNDLLCVNRVQLETSSLAAATRAPSSSAAAKHNQSWPISCQTSGLTWPTNQLLPALLRPISMEPAVVD